MSKRRRSFREGDIVAIKLGNGRMAFARALKSPLMAFYDLISTDVPPLEAIMARPIVFKLWVMRPSSDAWSKIGESPLEPELRRTVDFFKKDPISGAFSICRSDGIGEERPATREECRALESAAVWSSEHVEERLMAYAEGRPSQWAEMLKCK